VENLVLLIRVVQKMVTAGQGERRSTELMRQEVMVEC
jgi:hypothetical protein